MNTETVDFTFSFLPLLVTIVLLALYAYDRYGGGDDGDDDEW